MTMTMVMLAMTEVMLGTQHATTQEELEAVFYAVCPKAI
jgi:hypothetical protein